VIGVWTARRNVLLQVLNPSYSFGGKWDVRKHIPPNFRIAPSTMPAIESRNFAFCFAIGRTFLEIGALVMRDFPLRYPDF
jgi:hypothetical protein